MLEAVPGRMGDRPDVIRQLFLLVGKLLTSLRMVLAQQVHIPTLLKMIMDSYDEHQYSCCLDIMTTAVEVYGGADEAVEHFRALLGRASTRTFTTVQVRDTPLEQRVICLCSPKLPHHLIASEPPPPPPYPLTLPRPLPPVNT